MGSSALDLSSIIDNILDDASSPLLNFDSHTSPSLPESIRGVKEATVVGLRRQHSDSDVNRVRMTRESVSAYTILTGMDIVRKNNGSSWRRDSDAHTV